MRFATRNFQYAIQMALISGCHFVNNNFCATRGKVAVTINLTSQRGVDAGITVIEYQPFLSTLNDP